MYYNIIIYIVLIIYYIVIKLTYININIYYIISPNYKNYKYLIL